MRLKKVVSSILSVSVILSCFNFVQAKEKEWTPPENIIQRGDFEDINDPFYFEGKSATLKWMDDGGAEGTKGYVRVNGGGAAWGYLNWGVDFQHGETYTVSFSARTVGDESGAIDVIVFWASGGWTYMGSSLAIDRKWKRYTLDFTVPEKSSDGSIIDPLGASIGVRLKPGNQKWTMDMDELKVTPHGKVEYDYLKKDPYENSKFYTGTGLPEPKPIEKVGFSDTHAHWANDSIASLATAGYVNGVGNGVFEPDRSVTRAEYIKMIMSLIDITLSEYTGDLTDVNKDDWYADIIQTAIDCGVIDKVFTIGNQIKPNAPITREEAALITARVIEVKEKPEENQAQSFSDAGQISNWAKAGVETAVKSGVISGYPDGTFKPQNVITRAEASKMLKNALELYTVFEVYVDSENGSDTNKGTIDSPLKTIEKAKNIVAKYAPTMKNNIYVYMKGGCEYYIDKTLEWKPEESGQNGYTIIYTSYGEGQPIITGGTDYSSWSLHDEDLNIWRTFVGVGRETRQVFINDVKATWAESVFVKNGVLQDAIQDKKGYTCSDEWLLDIEYPEELEVVYHSGWITRICRVDTIKKQEDGMIRVDMHPEAYASATNGSHALENPEFLRNSYQLLDLPGEWYLNKHDGYLYYIPREYENPETMVATIPNSTPTFFQVGGTSYYNKVHNIIFDNLRFEYSGWLRATEEGGITGNQNTLNHPGAVYVRNGVYIDITNCTFRKLGAGAIYYKDAVQFCDIIGNEIYDIASRGIAIGDLISDDNTIRMPENFAYCATNIRINNNYLYDISNDYDSGTGISFTYIANSEVKNNEVTNAQYSGFHFGGGWQKFEEAGTNIYNVEITNNYIHETEIGENYDGASIYTLGATGYVNGHERVKINYNYMENHRNAAGCIYLDEGSVGWEVRGNVMDLRDVPIWIGRHIGEWEPQWLMCWSGSAFDNLVSGNYSTTATANKKAVSNIYEDDHIHPDADWPEEAQKTIAESGLGPEYLEKMPCGVQRIRLRMGDKKCYFLNSGETLQIKTEAYGRKLELIDVKSDELYYVSSDKSVATVSKDGVITAVGKGMATIYVTYLEGDMERTQKLQVCVDDEIVDIVPENTEYATVVGSTVEIVANAVTGYGNVDELDYAAFLSADERIATVDENGILTAVSEGKTTITAEYKAGAISRTIEYPVQVVQYVREDSEEFMSTAAEIKQGSTLFDTSRWTNGSEKLDDGVKLKTPGGVSYIGNSLFNSSTLFTYDMVIANPNSWPSIALNAVDFMSQYSGSDQYMIGFKPDYFELQRWNNGKRTMIFGNEFNPIAGPGIPNDNGAGGKIFDYSKRHTITTGAVKVEDGVRILLAVDGKCIFDYIDKSEDAISPGGYFGVYAMNGHFEVLPSTGQTK